MGTILNWNDICIIFVIAFLISKILDIEKLKLILKTLNDYKYLIGIITSLLVIFFLSGRNEYKTKCIITKKYISNNDLFLECKSFDGKNFIIPNAQKFWDAGKIRDTVWITYTNSENPQFITIKPIKDSTYTAFLF